jgi:hypothetical protein
MHPCAATCPAVLDPTSQRKVGSEAATCPAALDPTSLIRMALALSHVLWLQTRWEGSGSHLPDKKGSDAATCTVALDPLEGLRCATCPLSPDPASL